MICFGNILQSEACAKTCFMKVNGGTLYHSAALRHFTSEIIKYCFNQSKITFTFRWVTLGRKIAKM